MRLFSILVLLAGLGTAGPACSRDARAVEPAAEDPAIEPCQLALAPAGAGPLSREISVLQERAGGGVASDAAMEQLGYTFVARARLAHDEGLYAAALHAASCLEGRRPANQQARLLRGHVLHQQHRFREAEAIARALVESRGAALDYALLGDALMEQGRLEEAGTAYQRMIDLKPYYQSYARAAHLRWLRGNLPGAIELMQKALAAASPRDPEAAVWARARLAIYYLQAKRFTEAVDECEAALAARPGYAPALLALGRVRLAQGRPLQAVTSLGAAVAAHPLPEAQWILADALRAAARDAEAADVERALLADGGVRDPRTMSLYLATRGTSLDHAVALATRELELRADVFTHDTLAWALARAGRLAEARPHMARALAEGTADARLFLHGAAIAAAAGDQTEARRLRGRARALAHTLLPSERAALDGIRPAVRRG